MVASSMRNADAPAFCDCAGTPTTRPVTTTNATAPTAAKRLRPRMCISLNALQRRKSLRVGPSCYRRFTSIRRRRFRPGVTQDPHTLVLVRDVDVTAPINQHVLRLLDE